MYSFVRLSTVQASQFSVGNNNSMQTVSRGVEKDEFMCLQDLDESALLKTIVGKFVRSCLSKDDSVVFDATELVDTSFHVCGKHAVVLKELFILHGLQGLDHPKVRNQLNLLVACVQKIVWAKVWFFLAVIGPHFCRFAKADLIKRGNITLFVSLLRLLSFLRCLVESPLTRSNLIFSSPRLKGLWDPYAMGLRNSLLKITVHFSVAPKTSLVQI